MKPLRLSDFYYDLPAAQIAQQPLEDRDGARILIREKTGITREDKVKRLAEIIPKGSLILFNDSKVIPCRLFGNTESGAKVEIFLTKKIGNQSWEAIGRPSRKISPGKTIFFPSSVSAKVLDRNTEYTGYRTFQLEFSAPEQSFNDWIANYGHLPLPPYIKRLENKEDKQRYQTVFQGQQGSHAAPTAGLHFTKQLLEELRLQSINTAFLTHHVGLGTFMPVKTEFIEDHQMHEEIFSISEQTKNDLRAAKKAGTKIVCIGTTTFRAIETFTALTPEEQKANNFKTSLFLRPQSSNYQPFCNGLFTNFHQPGSTLFMLVAALIGLKEARDFYKLAIDKNFRFLSYGDASLLWF